MPNNQIVFEDLLTVAAEIGSMPFEDAQCKIIDSEDDAYAKCSLAGNNEHHDSCVPFTGLKQRGPDHQITDEDDGKAHYSPRDIPPPALNGDMFAFTSRAL
ncbi:MAG TPA: hypothetical protein VK671_11455 [Mucilaginibacter sp.]|nr:hypothetical protein [Mucilaginibacter sp.]